LRPLRNLVLVERILDEGHVRDERGDEVTAGGIIVPQDYKARGCQKAVRKADHFRARVIAVGPKVTDPLVVPGAIVPILTWSAEADGTRRGLYTGVDYTKDQLFVEWPDDFGGVVMNAPDAAEHRAHRAAVIDAAMMVNASGGRV
jgi:co-chaperonin GroES (HSP10)